MCTLLGLESTANEEIYPLKSQEGHIDVFQSIPRLSGSIAFFVKSNINQMNVQNYVTLHSNSYLTYIPRHILFGDDSYLTNYNQWHFLFGDDS